MAETPRIDREQARREALRLKMTRRPLGASGRIARAFLTSKLTPLLVVFSLLDVTCDPDRKEQFIYGPGSD